MTEFDVETRLEDYFTWLEDSTGQPMSPGAGADTTTTPGSAGGQRRWLLLGAAAACVGLLVGGLVLLVGDDQALSPATVPEPTATTASDTVTSTAVEPSPTTVPGTSGPATTAIADADVAVVWRSGVDSNRVNTDQPPPQWDVGETTVGLDIVGIVANDPTAGEYGELCREWVEVTDRDDEQCMLVQFRFDVGADATERGGITVPYVITAEGEQIDLFAFRTAWGDTDANPLIFAVPGAGPGSKIVFNVSGGRSTTDIEQDLEFVTPDASEWKPVDFFED